MKMKTLKILFLLRGLLMAGMIPAVAQSNPRSTSATDVETNLVWPDGVAYVNELHRNDTRINNTAPAIDYLHGIFMSTNWATYIDIVHWSETAGGTGELKAAYQNGPLYDSAYDLVDTWPAGRYPEFADGYEVSLPDGGTNAEGPPNFPQWSTSAAYGAINFVSANGSFTVDDNDQAQVALITGGEAGSTETELYQITGVAAEFGLTDQSLTSGTYVGIPPEQIQIGSLGSLVTSGMNGPYPSGTLYAVLPAHKQVPVTPHVKGSKYNRAGVSVQPYPLISQCVATTPSNRARTNIGVGEQVWLYFSPSLPTNATWTTTGGSLSTNYAANNFFTAPSNAANVTITATVFGKKVTKHFQVVEPYGICRAQITGTDHFQNGLAGAGMTNVLWIGPTNVSFYRVQVMEVGEDATNITGYFIIQGPQQLHHFTADHWSNLNQANQQNDHASFGGYSYSFWGAGGFEWQIPQKWRVIGSNITNSMTGCNQVFSIDFNGVAKISKYGNWVQRTTNDVINTN